KRRIPVWAGANSGGSSKSGLIKFSRRRNDDIDLQTCLGMNDVELGVSLYRVQSCILAHVELALRKLSNELPNGRCRKLDDNINIVGKSGFAIKDRHSRTRDEVLQSDSFYSGNNEAKKVRLLHATVSMPL